MRLAQIPLRQANAVRGIYPQAPLMPDLVDRIRAEVEARMRELRPVARELARFRRARTHRCALGAGSARTGRWAAEHAARRASGREEGRGRPVDGEARAREGVAGAAAAGAARADA